MLIKNKILLFLIVLCCFFSFSFAFDFQIDCEERNFVVTAYYSPKDWQAFYYKNNVIAEKTLNWSGTHGASGKPVFNGMLAAPSTYDFWWKIFFPSLGVWEISDRWWAIVVAWQRWDKYDRIDIWMGEWEEWLIRALTFGKRTLKWYYCDNNKLNSLWAKPKVWFNFNHIPVLKYFFDATLFIQELSEWRTDIRVYILQKYLTKFGYMKQQTWFFGPETKKALCNYQLKRWITSKKYCGVFWSTTRNYMKIEAQKKWFLPNFWSTSTFDELISFAQNYNWTAANSTQTPSSWIINYQLSTINYFNQPYKKDEQHLKILDLQDMLRHYGFFTWDLYDKYDAKTIKAIYDFQLALKILNPNDKNNPARWWMWPSTRKALNQKWAEFQEWKNSPPYEGG